MLSREAALFCKRGIIQYLNGNSAEFEKLVDKAMEINKVEPKWTNCKFWHQGEKKAAKIDFTTGIIVDMHGNILRRGVKAC
jgi:argininosuccinate synthase